MADVFKQRRDTAANFTAINPKLEDGQIAFETDTVKFKFGDGVTLWNSLGYVSVSIAFSAAAGITASATQTQGNGALTSQINEISTVGTSGDTVTLPAALAGEICIVINNGANDMKIFPASGDHLGAGLNNAMSINLAPGETATFYASDATNWAGTVSVKVN